MRFIVVPVDGGTGKGPLLASAAWTAPRSRGDGGRTAQDAAPSEPKRKHVARLSATLLDRLCYLDALERSGEARIRSTELAAVLLGERREVVEQK